MLGLMPDSDQEDQADEMATALQLPAANLSQLQVTKRHLGSARRNESKVWSTFLRCRILPTRSRSIRGVTTPTNTVLGQSQNCSGNLEIFPGIGTPGKFSGKHNNSGTLPKKMGTSKEILFHVLQYVFDYLGKLGLKLPITENIQTMHAAPRLLVYLKLNQSETH